MPDSTRSREPESRITSGHLLSIASMLASAAFFWGVLDARGERNEENIATMRGEVTRIEASASARVESLAAATGSRMDGIEGRLRAVEIFNSETRAEIRSIQDGIQGIRSDVRRVLGEHTHLGPRGGLGENGRSPGRE